MKRILITGITGFAGSHLAEMLVAGGEAEIMGTHISDNGLANVASIKNAIKLTKLNLLESEKTAKLIGSFQPDVVYHLAASTSVANSFRSPAEVITNNTTAQINVLEGLRRHQLTHTKVLIVSSSHCYGLVTPEQLPIDELTPFNPENPYSVSKITQDYLGLTYFHAYKMQIVRVRPFNHIGPRLSPDIAISRFAKSIVEIELGKKEPVLRVGNLTTKRDFTDVRDIVRGYKLAIDQGDAGDVYNLGSGSSFTMEEMLHKLIGLSTVQPRIETDPSLLRPSDLPDLRANAQKFMDKTGWKPEIPIEKTLQDTLNYWRSILSE